MIYVVLFGSRANSSCSVSTEYVPSVYTRFLAYLTVALRGTSYDHPHFPRAHLNPGPVSLGPPVSTRVCSDPRPWLQSPNAEEPLWVPDEIGICDLFFIFLLSASEHSPGLFLPPGTPSIPMCESLWNFKTQGTCLQEAFSVNPQNSALQTPTKGHPVSCAQPDPWGWEFSGSVPHRPPCTCTRTQAPVAGMYILHTTGGLPHTPHVPTAVPVGCRSFSL